MGCARAVFPTCAAGNAIPSLPVSSTSWRHPMRPLIPAHRHGLRASGFGAAMLLALAFSPVSSQGAPTLGFIEKWPTNLSGWGGSPGITFSNPLNGGADDDGVLQLSLASSAHFGTRSNGPGYTGDWLAAGVNQMKVKPNHLAS